jgi:hypothetical protein
MIGIKRWGKVRRRKIVEKALIRGRLGKEINFLGATEIA